MIRKKEEKMLKLILQLLLKNSKVDIQQINGFLTVIGLGVALGVVMKQWRAISYEFELDQAIKALEERLKAIKDE